MQNCKSTASEIFWLHRALEIDKFVHLNQGTHPTINTISIEFEILSKFGVL